MEFKEIAKKLNISTARAEQIYKAAMRKLKKQMPPRLLKEMEELFINNR